MMFPLKGWNARKLEKHLRDNPAARFGADRDDGLRPHRGVDLYGQQGAIVYAIDAGEIIQVSHAFFRGLHWIGIKEKDKRHLVGYGELIVYPYLKAGGKVKAGDALGYLDWPCPKLPGWPCMLHLEEDAEGGILDPTELLKKCEGRE